jgi:hypothetical protein
MFNEWSKVDRDYYDRLTAAGTAVFVPEPPEADHTQPIDYSKRWFLTGPMEVNGSWTLKYTLMELNALERARDLETVNMAARTGRDKRLRASDIMVLPDRWESYTNGEKSAWTEYRALLRDLPSQAGWPWVIDWPTSPLGER